MKNSEVIKQLWPHGSNDCACQSCQGMCRRTACLGTPQDILRIAHAGFTQHLFAIRWCAFVAHGIPAIDLVGISREDHDPFAEQACPFFNEASGLCGLHDLNLKPTEGRIASCQHLGTPLRNPSLAVALTWLLPRNQGIVNHLLRLVDPPRNEEAIYL